jgi:4-hydroxybenzoate polyprenyltransferase
LPLAAASTLLLERQEKNFEVVERLAVALAGAFAALSHAYLVNAVADRTTDTDIRKNSLIGMSSVPPFVFGIIAATFLLSLLLAAQLGLFSLICMALSLISGILYSVFPRLKGIPVAGQIGNAGIFFPLLFLAFPGFADIPKHVALVSLAFLVMLYQNQMVHELADLEEDSRHGDRSTASLLGVRGSRIAIGVGLLPVPMVLLVGGLSPLFLACSSSMVISTLICLIFLGNPVRCRVLHRYFAITAGIILFLGTFR